MYGMYVCMYLCRYASLYFVRCRYLMLTGLPPPAKEGVPATNSQPQPALKGALATARRQPQPATSRPAKMRIVVKAGVKMW